METMVNADYYTNWEGKGLEKPTPPPEVRDWQQTVGLTPQEEYMIHPSVDKVSLGLGWDKGVDVDASAALIGPRHEVLNLVWWHNLKSICKSVKHSGDDMTGEGGGDDEVITVDITDIPLGVHHIVFAVCIYTEGVCFDQLRRSYVRMMHGKPKYSGYTMCQFELDRMFGQAMLMGVMTRKGAYWSFKALGIPATGNTIQVVVKNPANLAFLQSSFSFPPLLRSVSVRVMQGAELVAKDTGRFGKQASSDPYFTLKFKKRTFKSGFIKKTLNPSWNEPAFDLGRITEAEPKALKIEVYDRDPVSQDDFMGGVRIPASALYNAGPGTHDFWFDLGPGKKEDQCTTVSGRILVSIAVEDS